MTRRAWEVEVSDRGDAEGEVEHGDGETKARRVYIPFQLWTELTRPTVHTGSRTCGKSQERRSVRSSSVLSSNILSLIALFRLLSRPSPFLPTSYLLSHSSIDRRDSVSSGIKERDVVKSSLLKVPEEKVEVHSAF